MTVPQTIRLGDVELPRLGLGTNRLARTRENVELLRTAVEAGVRHLDTAHLYAGGDSERTLGEALSPRPRGVVVATKGGHGPGEGRREALALQIDESLRRLRTDTIDLYYLHRVDPETPIEETAAVLADYRDRSVILHVGLSAVGVEEIERARSIVPVVAVQNRYNVSDRGSDDVVEYCEREGIVFVAFHPLKAESVAVGEVAERRGIPGSQVALAWLLHRSPAILPIPGTLSLAHLRENLAALELELSDGELAELG
jgi:aryl-alcohol dehydrogenase-like predicted oxidoreductase